MKADIDVIVLQYGSPELTVRLFQSMKKAKSPIRVIFVDNGSTDKEHAVASQALKETGLPVVGVRLVPNMGFPKAANVGLTLSSAPYVVIQGNDTEVFGEAYERMRRALDAEKSPAIVGPLTSACATSQHVERMGNRWPKEYDRLQKWGFLKASHERRAELARKILKGRVKELHDFISFFSIMMSRSTFEKLGLLDPIFSPGFGEDNDYCRRLREAGGKLLVSLDVYMVHVHRATFSRKMSKEDIWALQKRNQKILEKKWKRAKS